MLEKVFQPLNTPYPVGRPDSRCRENFILANIGQSNSSVS